MMITLRVVAILLIAIGTASAQVANYKVNPNTGEALSDIDFSNVNVEGLELTDISGLGTAAAYDIGNSGATIPLLDAHVTFSGNVTFTGANTLISGLIPATPTVTTIGTPLARFGIIYANGSQLSGLTWGQIGSLPSTLWNIIDPLGLPQWYVYASPGTGIPPEWVSYSDAGIQPRDATLLAIAAGSTGANTFHYWTGTDTLGTATITAAGRALLDDPDAAAQLITLGAQPQLINVDDSAKQLTSSTIPQLGWGDGELYGPGGGSDVRLDWINRALGGAWTSDTFTTDHLTVSTNLTLPTGSIQRADIAADAVGTDEIEDGSVAFADIQNLSTQHVILGRESSGAGSAEEITYVDGLFESNIYSTIEVLIGEWDGAPLYRKMVNVGALPNATTTNDAHGISGGAFGGGSFRKVMVRASNGTETIYFGFASSGLSVKADATNVVITSPADHSAYSGYAILEYTK